MEPANAFILRGGQLSQIECYLQYNIKIVGGNGYRLAIESSLESIE